MTETDTTVRDKPDGFLEFFRRTGPLDDESLGDELDETPSVAPKKNGLDFKAIADTVLDEAGIPTAEEARKAAREKLKVDSSEAEIFAVVDMIARDTENGSATADREIAAIAAIVKDGGVTKLTLKQRLRATRDRIQQEATKAKMEARAEMEAKKSTGCPAGAEGNFHEMLAKFDKRCGVAAIGNTVRVVVFPEEGTGLPKFLDKDGFLLLNSTEYGYLPGFDQYGNEVLKKTPIADFWLLAHEDRPSYDDVTFHPYGINERPGQNDLPPKTLNLWRGWSTKPIKGDWSLLRQHIFENICHSNPEWFAWFMSWAADIVQDPRNKKGTAVVVKGVKRTGKTKFAEWFRELMPYNSNSITKSEQLVGRFNKHQTGSLFTVLEEAIWSGDKKAEGTVKSMITDKDQFIEGKHVDGLMLPSFTRFFYISNEDRVVPTSDDDARFFVLEILPNRKEDFKFFDAVDKQMKSGGLEAMFYDLANLKRPDWVQLRKPPDTPWLQQQVKESHNILEQWWSEFMTTGEFKVPPKAASSSPFGPAAGATIVVPERLKDKDGNDTDTFQFSREDAVAAAQAFARQHGTRYVPVPSKVTEFLESVGGVVVRTKHADGRREYMVRITTDHLPTFLGQSDTDPDVTRGDPDVTRGDAETVDPCFAPWIAYGQGGELPG